MSFITVGLSEWDCDKVTVGKLTKNDNPTILYDGKLIILNAMWNDKGMFLLKSYKGLEKSNVFNSSTRKFTDEWSGAWHMNIKICDTIDSASEPQKKLMMIFDDMKKKVEEAFGRSLSAEPISYKYKMEENKAGVPERKGILTDKAAYMNIKVPYDADDDAKTFMQGDKNVPVLEARYPKTEFFDIDRPRGKRLVEDPSKECKISMKVVPRIMISVFSGATGLFLTRKMMKCYYEYTPWVNGDDDDDLIDQIRASNDEIEMSE